MQKKSRKKIAPSILSADFTRLGEEIDAVEKAGADWIHVDVMDGHFVPNITIGPFVVEAARRATQLPLDVHLMIENPSEYIAEFAKAGASSLTIHAEAVKDLRSNIELVRKLGVKVGVSISPPTSIDCLIDVLPHVDLILIMTVNPGFGGQAFMPECIEKIEKLADIRKKQSLPFLIEVDGGINEKTAQIASAAGCDIFVAGSAVFKTKDYKKAIEGIRAVL